MKRFSRGFTLIELLIVVGIISILAAIAMPNFLEAQVRAKCARVKSDLRSISVAWEAYAVDNDRYPVDWDNYPDAGETTQIGLIQVTTPIAYLTSFPTDPFSVMLNPNHHTEYAPHFEIASCSYAYCMFSLGPGFVHEFTCSDEWPDGVIDSTPGKIGQMYTGPIVMRPYDPTNGVVSDGNLHKMGGDWRRDRAPEYGGNWTVWDVDYHQWNLPIE
jgi:prepilin-type N-terminal cleavage/methylation domain-containing protein